MFGHLSSVLVVAVDARWKNLLIRKIFIMFYHLLLLLVWLGSLYWSPVTRWPLLVGPWHRPPWHSRCYSAEYSWRYRRGCTVTRLTIP